MKIFFLIVLLVPAMNIQAQTLGGFTTSFYGFIKPSVLYSDGALASFNNINSVAPTHAVARTRKQDKSSRLSTQLAQSRLGLSLAKGPELSARMEFDFVDFNRSSPTVQMVPRVRMASVTYAWDNQKIIIGQDWDLFSPVNTYTFNYISNYYFAGNAGFMRQQLQYIKQSGDIELAAALGNATSNPGPQDADVEFSKAPSYAARASYKLTSGRVGLSAIYARAKFTSNSTYHESYAGNVFFERLFGELSLRTEAYYGQNLGNISLTIGRGTAVSDIKEFGGMMSTNYKLRDRNFIFGGAGLASVENRSQLTPFSLSPTTFIITSPGISRNFVSRIGFEHQVTEDLSWISEMSRYETHSKISDNQYQLALVYGFETGIQLRF